MKIKCELCQGEFNFLSENHLKTHNVTKLEYIDRFPNSPTISDEYSKMRREKSTEQNKKLRENPEYSHIVYNRLHSRESINKRVETRKRRKEEKLKLENSNNPNVVDNTTL